MARCLYLYLILLLTIGQRQVISSAPTYSLQEAIDDISYFIPGSKIVLNTALKLAYVYGEIKQILDPNSTHVHETLGQLDGKVDAINSQLGDMSIQLSSISDDVKDVKNLIQEQIIQGPMQVNLDNQKRTLQEKLDSIENLFQEFLDKSESLDTYENYTILNFANVIIDSHTGVLNFMLKPIHNIITRKYSDGNVLQSLANKRLSMAMMCKNNPPASSAQKIVNLYHDILMAEVKGVVLTEFAYSVKRMFEQNTKYRNELDKAKVSSYNRTISTVLEVKRVLQYASRDFWMCDPPVHEEGTTYAKLGPIFQSYFLYEKDIAHPKYSSKKNKCSGTCADRDGANPDVCRSKQCQNFGRPCTGLLHDCEKADKQIKFCAADKNGHKRYEYVELLKTGEVLGQKKSCKAGDEFTYHKKDDFTIYHCDVCVCTCENSQSEINRYFNLKPVTSDVESNKVVTGVRFRKDNDIFHVQIQQGQLQKNGNVKRDTVDWKPIDSYTVRDKNIVAGRDYHNITYNDRTVFLDNIDSPKSNVLTGLRFQLQENNLKLEIQVTPFNFTTGELKKDESKWLSNSNSINERSEVDVKDRSLPTSSFINSRNSDNNQYIQFKTSSLKSDVGQSVVPFIDLQEISSDPPLPLSGAGLIHKGNKESAGFLAMQLSAYNFAPHLHI